MPAALAEVRVVFDGRGAKRAVEREDVEPFFDGLEERG